MSTFDYPQMCTTCQGYKTMPFSWNSTSQPKMCTCPKPVNLLGSLAWECPRCKKINAPWKESCNCTPSPLSSSITSSTQPYAAGPNPFTSTLPDPFAPKPPNI